MKQAFYLDTDLLSEEECAALCGALSGVAESDVPFVLELLCVGEEEIRKLNREQRGVDRVTDVLSFPSMDDVRGKKLLAEEHGDELDEEGRLFLGSVVVCKTRAEEQADEYGHSFQRELFYLAVHGTLHCLGYDHETEEDKREMRKKEEEILGKMNLSRE